VRSLQVAVQPVLGLHRTVTCGLAMT